MKPTQTIDKPVSLSLAAYSGPWTELEAAHLLRRTMFGATLDQIRNAVSDGLSATITKLMSIPSVNPPLTHSADETIANFGETWIDKVYPSGTTDSQSVDNARSASLGAWLMDLINKEDVSIAQKMCLFWQNHFAATQSFDARATYFYHDLLRTHALGNFKQLVKDMTIDPNMLFFLNGVSNQSFSPNENYAREILELYTIGKGPQIGVGDYTNYTEDDVAAGSRIFTGWTVDGMRSTTITKPVAVFNTLFHTATTKQLSYHFNNQTISNGGNQEYANYIDVIFQQPAVATFICTKLYRYFVNYDITTDVIDNVIPQMATTLIANNYEIQPVLEELFASDHFYDISLRGTIIKNPLELIFSMLNTSNSRPNFDLESNVQIQLTLYWLSGQLGQYYGDPPNVGGWPAYYQEPSYSKLWINSTYIKTRFDVGYYLSLYTGIDANGNKFKINALNLLPMISDPSDPVAVIDDLCLLFFPKEVADSAKITLKTILLNGLPDFEWTLQYNDFIANQGDTSYSDPIRVRLETVLYTIFQMPEFQMI